jgi:hypothetical protein
MAKMGQFLVAIDRRLAQQGHALDIEEECIA